MLCDPALGQVDWSRRTEPENLPEWMDEPCSDDEMRACLHDLTRVNRISFGYRPTLGFFERLLPRAAGTRLRILDVGFGGGDMLLRIARWARAKRINVELVGIDLNPQAARIARARYPDAAAEWLTGDALGYCGEVDVVISSLLTHHLATPYVAEFVRWMEAKAALGWFVNDLERSARSAALFGTLARVMGWHRFVRHDGPISFARSFSHNDWSLILSQAGVPTGVATVARNFPARLCVSRLK